MDSERTGSKGFGLVSLLVLVVAIGMVAAQTASAMSTDFCGAPSANPFASAFDALPPLHAPPADGRLPFNPDLYLKLIGGPLVATGDPIGFTVPSRPETGEKKHEPPKIRAAVSRLDADGKVQRVLKRIDGTVRHLHPATKISYLTPRASALYRVTVVFETQDRKILARYGQYVRAAPPKFAARVALSGTEVVPGSTVTARLENTGIAKISTGYGYRAERFNGSSWEADPTLQPTRNVPKVAVVLGPLATFDCFQLAIPPSQSPGRYRLVKEVGLLGSDKRRRVSGEFSVVS